MAFLDNNRGGTDEVMASTDKDYLSPSFIVEDRRFGGSRSISQETVKGLSAIPQVQPSQTSTLSQQSVGFALTRHLLKSTFLKQADQRVLLSPLSEEEIKIAVHDPDQHSPDVHRYLVSKQTKTSINR